MTLGGVGSSPAAAEGPDAVLVLPTATSADGCRDQVLARNDDGSSTAVALPFTLNFFGVSRNSLFVNNNGNVTFDSAMSTFTPFPIVTTGRQLIAPFFADVDTRNVASDVVRYTMGFTTFGGNRAFCVNWVNVGYFNSHADKLNSFQLVLVERADVGVGDFDIIMNYDKILWETGDASGGSLGLGGSPARMGFSNGSSASFEQPGSGQRGAFLNSNLVTGLIHNSRNTTQLGRYVFPVRNGAPPTGATVNGTVANSLGAGLSGALVQLCGGGFCNLTPTSSGGVFVFTGVGSGSYQITANPPSGSTLNQGSAGPIAVGSTNVTVPPIILSGPLPIPAGTTITNRYINPAGIPVIYWNDPLTLTTTGCLGGTATYEIRRGGAVIRSGAMTEGPAGSYTASVTPLFPNSGYAQVIITIVCGGVPTMTQFDIYIDPSGHVRTATGDPIAGATVTLFRSDSAGGPFAVVPNGSAVMSPANRVNPDTTDANGRFGWDVITGFYRVRASAQGCVSPTDPSASFVETAVLTIPPPVTDLDLRLSCPSTNRAPIASAGGPYAAGEGASVQLNGTGTDPDQDPLTFAWDLDNNGTFETAGQTATFSAAAIDGPASRQVALRVCDNHSACATANATVDITNVAPTAHAANNGPNYWGLPITFTGTATDPSPTDSSVGFTGAWAFGDDESGTGMTAEHSYSSPGTYTARFTATDKDGGTSAPATTEVLVNKRPTSLSCADTTATFGFPVTFSATGRDEVGTVTITVNGLVWLVDDQPAPSGVSPRTAMPGTHLVTARFPGDSQFLGSTATCSLTVVNSVGKVTGGGRTPNEGRGGFNANNDPVDGLSGSLQFQNEQGNFHAHGITALGISTNALEAWFAGVGTDGRVFVVNVIDMGEPGADDVFRLWIAGVAQNGDGTLTGGNIQIHRS
jgi:hypothetical protein